MAESDVRNASSAALTLVLVIAVSVLVSAGTTLAASSDRGTVNAVKTVPSITASNQVTVVLTITDNSSLPVEAIEVYDYFNPSFTLSGSVTITQPSGTSTLTLSPSNTVTQVQAIIDPPSPDSLLPKQSMTLKYVEVAAGPGDFQIPPALVWFTYSVGSTDIKSSFYSNGIVVHIENAAEKLFAIVFPYVLAATTFTATMIILTWARRQLGLIEKKKLAR